MTALPVLDAAGRRRSPATMPGCGRDCVRFRGQRSVAQPRTVRGLENYPGRGLTWRCSCQSSPAASSASWMRCHAAPSDSSSRMRTCPRSSGICVPRPRCLATAASSSSARLPGRVTWTTIAVSGTRADRSRGPPTHPARAHPVPPPPARNLTRGRAGSRRVGSGRAHSAAARCCRGPRRRAGRGLLMLGRACAPKRRPSKKTTSQGGARVFGGWRSASAAGGSAKLRGISSDRSCGSCGRPLPSLS